MTKYELYGCAAIATGAGIGEACSRVLVRSGASVLAFDLDGERGARHRRCR